MTQDLAALVAALPERYQPIYGEGDDGTTASRQCDDRVAVIAPIVTALQDALGRPVRVLDLGCAQGYFSLSLAALGAHVTGVDRGSANIALCRALALRHPGLRVSFVEADAVGYASSVAEGEVDVVLALSVVHHIAHEQSPGIARRLLADLAARTELLLVETAVRQEPVYWAQSLPADPREHLADVPFVHAVARFPTHLSDVERPLFFASARWWRLGSSLARFERWTAAPHAFAGDVHRGTRRYYFGVDFAKQYLLEGDSATRNRAELAREEAFLRDPPADFGRVPRVVASGIELGQGFLVRELLDGELLSDAMYEGAAPDALAVIGDVLDELCALESAGRYHGDVRPWNVLLHRGRATLIDYGDVTADPVDCAWPGDPFTAFLVFAHEVQSGRVHPPSDARAVRFAPHDFEGRLHAWATRLWCADATWTFAWMRDELRRASRGAGEPSLTDVLRAERNAGARVQSLLTARFAEMEALRRAAYDRLEAEHRARVEEAHAVERDRLSLVEANDARQQEAEAAAERERAAGRHIVELSERIAQAERTRQESMAEIARQSAQIDALQIREAQLASAHAALAAAKAELESSATALSGALAKLGEEHEALQARCASLDADRVAAHAEAHRWWQQSVEWHREVQAMQRTGSWRMTAPLRWAKRSAEAFARAARRGPRGVARPAVAALARPFMDHPALRYRVATLTRKFPSLHARLRDYVTPTPQPAHAAEDDNGLPAYLTPRVRDVLRDLERHRNA